MLYCIIYEFYNAQELYPVTLIHYTIDPKIIFKYLILVFYLAVDLQIKGNIQILHYPKVITEGIPKLTSEKAVSIRDNPI